MRAFVLFLTVLLAGAALAQQSDPVACIREYYEHLAYHSTYEAYQLRSEHSRRELSPERFREVWANNVSVEASGFALESQSESRAVVRFIVRAVDFDRGTGQRERAEYAATAVLVHGQQRWWVDEIQVNKLRSSPVTGLELSHGEELVQGAQVEALPADVPLHPGFKMSGPLLVKAFDRKVRKVVSLNRQKSVRPIEVFEYYRKALPGWATDGPAGGSSSLSATFTKGSRKLTIHVYSGIHNGTDQVGDPRGTRLEIEY
ncbi:MAG: hypothetical protein AB1758_21000 [Candidatus Eremiobacterota bacterium]